MKYTNKTTGIFIAGNVIYDFWAHKFYKVL